MISYIEEEMIKIGADGVIFHPIFIRDDDVFLHAEHEFTLETIQGQHIFPRSGRTYYKIINGIKVPWNQARQSFFRCEYCHSIDGNHLQKGLPYEKDNPLGIFIHENGAVDIFDWDTGKTWDYKFNCCPMCGRRLNDNNFKK